MATVIQIKGLDKLMANLKRIARDAPQAFAGALYRFAEEQIAGPARAKFVPVVTGALRNSIMVQIPEVVGQRVSVVIGAGGAAAPYALCVGARMKVQTRNRGMKHMNQIRQNDEVLTQAGVWKPVKQVFRYPVADGTTLISIHVPWRKGQEHILEATEHHHLMVERAGKNQWVQAGNLQVGDIVYQRMKQAHNKGDFNAKFSPRPLNPNPLPSVYYVAVNPGPETYVEPTAFKRAAITKIDREIYCRRMGSRKAVYDLEVADINSYVVSGMIVHNSVHENPRSGKTGGFSPSGAPYKNWSRVGQWKWLEAPALESAKHSGILIQDIRTELEKIARG